MERMRKIRADISDFDSAERLSGLGIDVYISRAVFDSPTSVCVDGRRIIFRKVIRLLLILSLMTWLGR